VRVGVEPETVEAEGADLAPWLTFSIVNRFDITHRAHELDSPGSGDLSEERTTPCPPSLLRRWRSSQRQ